jgi:uncharacterized membrane protein
MTEMVSYKVTELKLEIVNWYFEMSVFHSVLFDLGGWGFVLHYTFPDIFSGFKEYS